MFEAHKIVGRVAVFGAAAAALALAAPTAGATITGIDIASGLSFGSSTSYGVGCSYTVTVTAAPGTSVSLKDVNTDNKPEDGYWLSFNPIGVVTDSSGKGTTTWYPRWKGLHTITGQEFGSDATFTVTATAGTGTKTGPACLVS
ncbi:hypothetical protein AB0N05_12930 [Nocardia sp. NPDC051030]|uniref:hypothetical protein n=1 Tax=Nocardia sp. NPDC051030 TaxID=3155162 RepID=UPI0034343709